MKCSAKLQPGRTGCFCGGDAQRVTETKEFEQLAIEIERGTRVISVSGLVAGSARALALAALQRQTGKLKLDEL